MTATDIRVLTRATPFKPFRVTISNGEEFDIRHPDMIMTIGGMVILSRESSTTFPPPDDLPGVHVSLQHVLKIEHLTPSAAPPVDRSTV